MGRPKAQCGKRAVVGRVRLEDGGWQAGNAVRRGGSIPAPPGRATRLRMLLRARMSRAYRAPLPPRIAYGLIGKHVALSGKELTPHRSSISAQACAAGQAESSMRSRLRIPAPPGRAARLRMLLRTRMSRAARASLPHSLADGAFGRPGTICRAAGVCLCRRAASGDFTCLSQTRMAGSRSSHAPPQAPSSAAKRPIAQRGRALCLAILQKKF